MIFDFVEVSAYGATSAYDITAFPISTENPAI
jgi:hypothetical protein